ncbi:Bug family tripartite tricarboxylate transporter substrate binding protein [Paralcaligenes ureilyticus]|uniref:Tripartite-type tricarboxylate transporter receptor subunit TctC n=1 Tax=Paralcaligenes ureilyticus TaxID=627131 RepID=A0A4R3MAX8_9BURK|nr:tripartite-type tricarboxylate transporter receptor subunit TctC [Paralcaligenes ureilyticus]
MRTFKLGTCALLVGTALVALPACAAGTWPDHTIVFVAPFSPGGANDLVARIFAKEVSKELKQSVIVENRPGAGGVVGAAHVAHSKPDGYTYLVGANGTITNSLIRATQPYKDAQLTPVALMGVAPSVIVTNASNPANNLKEFVENAKKNHVNRITFAVAGVGSTPDFVGEMMKEETGLPMQAIPYKSGSEDVNAVMGNQVDATSEASIVTLPLVKAGKLKALATTWGGKLASAPNIKTTAEEGYPNIRIGHWEGLFAPTGTPATVLDKMNAAIQKAAKSKEVLDALDKSSIEPGRGTRAEFIKFTQDERARLGKVVAKGHMKAS